jgi:transitional endoplasmic reticulum ATPase
MRGAVMSRLHRFYFNKGDLPMATLSKKEIVHVAQIVQHGDQLNIPEGMSGKQAIALIERWQTMQEETVNVTRDYDVFVWDGAYGLAKVLANKFGWVDAKATPGFFGPTPPRFITVEVAPGLKDTVLWGRIGLPVLSGGYLQTGVKMAGKRMQFRATATVPRKAEKMATEIFDALDVYLKDNSIYKGKALKLAMEWNDDVEKDLFSPSFIDTSKIDTQAAVYSDDVEQQLETNLFTPIKRIPDLRMAGIPVKRGVMLAGVFGTGKTLAARNASRYATDNGVTYIYCPKAELLAQTIDFARQYAPAVVFCEDVDRVTDGERTVSMDDLLNILDGVDTKKAEIITVLTTNAVENINPAMLRPGRLDAIIEITKPDAQAVERLVRMYGGVSIEPEANLTQVGILLADNIPAVIAEVVHRAKLAQLSLVPVGHELGLITEQALIIAAESMKMQLKLLETNKPVAPPTLDFAFRQLVNGNVEKAIGDVMSKFANENGWDVPQLTN